MSKLHGPIFMLGAVLSCKEVNKMLASGLPLSFMQKVKLWCHLRICYTCKRFEQHLLMLAKSFRSVCESEPVKPEEVSKLEESVLKDLMKK